MRPPRKFTPDQRHEIWERIDAGESPASITRSMGRYPSAVRSLMLETGGIAPPVRTRSPRCLSVEEREEISRGLAAGDSLRAIAARLGRAPSSVSREVSRNGGRSHYRAQSADRRAYRRARRPKVGKLSCCPRLRDLVAAKPERRWSPEQISRWLMATFPENPELHVSHETIYLALYVQGRGELRRELQHSLRSGRTLRRFKTRLPTGVGQLPDRVMISERPAEVEDRAVPGHWEGDLIMGSKNSCIGTLVERSTRYVMLLKLERPTAEE
jgi:IS30 family transposase